MAADQLGDIAKQHPEDILSLLSRVYPFLLVKKWETRVTAARAVGAIVSMRNYGTLMTTIVIIVSQM